MLDNPVYVSISQLRSIPECPLPQVLHKATSITTTVIIKLYYRHICCLLEYSYVSVLLYAQVGRGEKIKPKIR